jgi:hypothetical protein
MVHAAVQVVHRVGRHFGFQAFNLNPRLDVSRPLPMWLCSAVLLPS